MRISSEAIAREYVNQVGEGAARGLVRTTLSSGGSGDTPFRAPTSGFAKREPGPARIPSIRRRRRGTGESWAESGPEELKQK